MAATGAAEAEESDVGGGGHRRRRDAGARGLGAGEPLARLDQEGRAGSELKVESGEGDVLAALGDGLQGEGGRGNYLDAGVAVGHGAVIQELRPQEEADRGIAGDVAIDPESYGVDRDIDEGGDLHLVGATGDDGAFVRRGEGEGCGASVGVVKEGDGLGRGRGGDEQG